MGELEEEGGEGDSSSLPEYCSESDGIVIVDSVKGVRSEVILEKNVGGNADVDFAMGTS
jgi:hypothetical protein